MNNMTSRVMGQPLEKTHTTRTVIASGQGTVPHRKSPNTVLPQKLIEIYAKQLFSNNISLAMVHPSLCCHQSEVLRKELPS
jgi:hypothetical protein